MFAMLDGLKTRVSNLTARHEAEEAAGDDAAAARTAEEVQSLVAAHEEIIKNVDKQPTCQLTLEVSAFGTLVMTMNQGKLSESLMSLCTAFLRHLGKEKGEGKDVGPQVLVVEALKMMMARAADEPLVVTFSANGGAASPVTDIDAPLENNLATTERDPRDVTICVTPKIVLEALAAPRCLLVITDPGGSQLYPLDERALKTPLMELAWKSLAGGRVMEPDALKSLLADFRTTAVGRAAVPRRRVPRERRGLGHGRGRGGRRFACGVSQAEQRRGRRGRPERAGDGRRAPRRRRGVGGSHRRSRYVRAVSEGRERLENQGSHPPAGLRQVRGAE